MVVGRPGWEALSSAGVGKVALCTLSLPSSILSRCARRASWSHSSLILRLPASACGDRNEATDDEAIPQSRGEALVAASVWRQATAPTVPSVTTDENTAVSTMLASETNPPVGTMRHCSVAWLSVPVTPAIEVERFGTSSPENARITIDHFRPRMPQYGAQEGADKNRRARHARRFSSAATVDHGTITARRAYRSLPRPPAYPPRDHKARL
jgi:hypothetical protein